jgi:hypothetical protein
MKPIEVALYNKLKAGTAITALVGGTASYRIYNTVHAQGASLPSIVFQKQGGGHTPDTPRENVDIIYTVKVLSDNLQTAENIDQAITAALDRQDLSVGSGYADYGCFRIGHVHFMEGLIGGSIIYHVGGMYRILASKT